MTILTIYDENSPENILFHTEDVLTIQKSLNELGIIFERWHANSPIPQNASQDEIITAYAEQVSRVKRHGGYTTADVLRVTPQVPNKDEIRAKFLNEHTHNEDEVRFFVEGVGAFYLRINGKVHKIVCMKDDLLSVPKGTKHWFDMGENPNITAIRFFEQKEGWTPHFTGDDIATRFPKLQEITG